MSFTHKRFNVGDIEQQLNISRLDWPVRGGAGGESTLGGNRHYQDLRLMDWAEARRVLDVEAEYVRRIEAADDVREIIETIDEEREAEWDGDGDPLFGLDIGVAGAVIALSAARCIPFSSCNGGAFEGGHHERHPLVAFYVRPQLASIMVGAAKAAGAGLQGAALLYAEEITAMMRFAEQLYLRRAEIDAIALPVDRSGDDVDDEDGS